MNGIDGLRERRAMRSSGVEFADRDRFDETGMWQPCACSSGLALRNASPEYHEVVWLQPPARSIATRDSPAGVSGHLFNFLPGEP